MSTFTKEQLIEEVNYNLEHCFCSEKTKRLMEIAMAALTAEPDYYVVVTSVGVWQSFCKTKAEAEFIVSKPFNPGYSIREIYTAPPAPESVPDGVLKSLLPDAEKSEFWFEHDGKILFEGVKFNNAVFDACRAAMLQEAK